MTIKHLSSKGHSGRAIARLLGASESTVRYHLQRQASGAIDGRSAQPQAAADFREAIEHYLQGAGKGFIDHVDGLRSTVIGLPLEPIIDLLFRYGVLPLTEGR